MKKVYLSPSSQIHNAYTGVDTNECVQCNRIAEAAEAALTRCGVQVKRAPFDQDMQVSIRESNAFAPDLHIPIHTNAGGGQGPLVMVYSDKSAAMTAAQPIYDAVREVTPGDGGYGVRVNPQLAELNATRAAAVYIECEFHDRAELARWIVDNVVMLGEAIAKGVCRYFGVQYQFGQEEDEPEEEAASPSPAPSGHKYQVGDVVTFSTCYRASTDPVEKHTVPAKGFERGTITKVLNGVHNPYLINGGQCWVNDGDIRRVDAPEPSATIKVGSSVRITGDKYSNGQSIPGWVKQQVHVVNQIQSGRALLGYPDGICSWVPMDAVVLV